MHMYGYIYLDICSGDWYSNIYSRLQRAALTVNKYTVFAPGAARHDHQVEATGTPSKASKSKFVVYLPYI